MPDIIWQGNSAGQVPISSSDPVGAVLTRGSANSVFWQTLAPGGVTSVFGRTGNVVAVNGDYPGNILAVTTYGPATSALIALTAVSMTPLDTTNLTFAFVAPPSGRVLITSSGYWNVTAPATTSVAAVLMGLRDHTSHAQIGARQRAMSTTTGATEEARIVHYFLVTGLTAGTTYQYDLCGWFQLLSGTGTPTGNFYADDGTSGGTNQLGPAVFVVMSD